MLMFRYYCSPLFSFVLISMMTFSGTATAGSITRSTTDVFKFQQTLAERGNAQAQYKLATMYELGIGVEMDLVAASQWYSESLDNGIESAEDRLIYLDIRQQGYDQHRHAAWMKKIQNAADSKDQNAKLLLGQMYSHGLGVSKNLGKARECFSSIDVLSNPIVAYELERINVEEARADAALVRKQQQAQAQKAEQARQQQQAKRDQVEQKEAQLAEKRRRYEEVMQQLAEEQRILEQTQAWAEGKRDELPDSAMAVK
jgi:hypothetical protein